MATRSLTEAFILMRNNALQSKHIFGEQVQEDTVALVGQDVERGFGIYRDASEPPRWVDALEEINYQITKIKEKLKDLSALHDRHLNRPTFDESSLEEDEIEQATHELTQLFSHCQQLLSVIQQGGRHGSNLKEASLAQNVVRSVAGSLQSLTTTFRSSQTTYCKMMSKQMLASAPKASVAASKQCFAHYKTFYQRSEDCRRLEHIVQLQTDILKAQVTGHSLHSIGLANERTGLQSREEHSNKFFDVPFYSEETRLSPDAFKRDQEYLMEDQLFLEDNTEMVQMREREINTILRSITELNSIFKDIASMVAEQGTVLDRIDYNLDNVQTRVQQGLQQLQKADTFQKKNHKMMCILVMAASTIILIVLLFVLKF